MTQELDTRSQEEAEELHNLRERNAQLERAHAELTVKFAVILDALLLARTYERNNLKEIAGLKARIDILEDNCEANRGLADAAVAHAAMWQAKFGELKAENEKLRKDAERFAGIKELLGYVEDGSADSIVLVLDDATRSYCLCAGKKWYYGDSLGQAIDAAMTAPDTEAKDE